ncbi:putative gag-polypeptide of LTR copia-type [Rosa chinensis]|uniref:Putative gag-polypeptide of LTR copia-type n=1 Tax=Rosa chinensis TaxID=74649 RepID=A0A2P6P327_ROSCH|nr:putative gag-polypeptide of LTR copia-type [Rosa chinensis]
MVNPAETNSSTSTEPSFLSPEIAPNHVASLIPLKLTKDNYLLWKDITTLVLQNYGMYSLVDGSETSPPPLIGTQANPAYPIWLKKDRTCRLWLTASLSEP